ncbi:hypothetical protein LCI18_011275 [Fusarium solani-melongenae]|uniref:Uncharacterized protein n=1 Tax=Fusarium solani subsp. cucurbitae TaxID=2747967 RepID=A0ACD3ZGI0_FUSSC|nr:hypothetical protein LCI18_011275 [Fusarium solani-melongenae]
MSNVGVGSEGASPPRPPRSKRNRLSLACTQCRKRKVRCDASTPKCRNCVLRGDDCETFDPRRPNGPAVRRWPAKAPQGEIARRHSSISEHSSPSSLTSVQHDRAASLSRSGTKERHPSWIERAYQESQTTPDHVTDGQTNDSPDVVMNTDDTSHRVKYMGSSSMQCLCQFIDLCFERKGLEAIGPYFRWGMSFTEEFQLPLIAYLPDLPDMPLMEPLIEVFFNRTHPLVPVLDRTSFVAEVTRLLELQQAHDNGLQAAISSADAPALITIYSVLALGMDDSEGTVSATATPYLTAAYSLTSHCLSLPYTSSVQALVMLAIALRARSKEGQSWHLLGQAIRIGHSLGFHRQIVSSESTNHPDRRLHSRIWWACYALEKMMSLETGRPSVIEEFDCDQAFPDRSSGLSPYFVRWVSLSQIVGQIGEHVYRRKATSSLGLLSEIARLDQALLDWVEEGSEGPKSSQRASWDSRVTEEEKPLALFLSLQYHQAQITLLRASLIFPEASFTREANSHGSKLKGAARLLQGQNTCVEAARSIITQVAEFADSHAHFMLLTPTQTFLAAVTLALHTLKKPHKRMGRSDGELVRTASDYVADYYRRVGQSEELVKGVLELSRRMNQVLSGEGIVAEQAPRVSSQEAQDTNPVQSAMSPSQFYDHGMEPLTFDPTDQFQDPFQDMPLDQFWAIMEGEFTTISGQNFP